MAYEFVPRKEYKIAAKIAREFVQDLQRSLKGVLVIDRSLIGSVKSRLVTRNGKKEPFDFDYQFEIKREIIDFKNSSELLQFILNKINEIKDSHGFDIVQNSSRVFRLKYKHENSNLIWFNIELAILKKIYNIMNILYFDKSNQKVILNQEKYDFANDKELRSKFLEIRKNTDNWLYFKKKYLMKKNSVEYKNRKSISIYKETINDFFK